MVFCKWHESGSLWVIFLRNLLTSLLGLTLGITNCPYCVCKIDITFTFLVIVQFLCATAEYIKIVFVTCFFPRQITKMILFKIFSPLLFFFFLQSICYSSSHQSICGVSAKFLFPPAINNATTKPKIDGGKKNMLQGKRI